MKGFRIEDGQFVIRNGARVVATTEGKLTGFLPTLITLTPSLVFPDFSKDYDYLWQWLSDWNSGASAYGWASSAVVAITAVPQEYAVDIPLMAVPTGADIFFGSVQLSRSSAPSHTWLGATIDPLVPMGVAIPITGSLSMEAGMGMARSLSVYISGSNLIARIQQSVSTAAGGYGYYGNTSVAVSNDSSGGENVFGSQAGIPVYTPGVYPWYTFSSGSISGSVPTPAGIMANFRRGGGAQASTSDPTNYSSTYSAIIKGRFGRRS